MMTQQSGSETHVLVLTDSSETAQLVPALLREVGGFVVYTSPATGGDALAAVDRYQPQVVVIADTLEHLPTVVAVLDATSPEVLQVVILPEGDADGAVACSLAGARATLMKPFDRQRLLGAIQIVYSRDLRIRQQLGAGETAGAAGARQQRPRIIAVHGAKGGVGTTAVACNLAAALHRVTRRRVALIDGDLLGGGVGVLCNLPPTRTLTELLPEVHQLDDEVLDGAFLKHPSGISVLLAPDGLEQAEAIAPDEVKRALNALRPHFDYQVVDTPAAPVPATLAVMDEADLIVLVLTPDLAALRNAARFVRLAAQLGFPNENIMLVVNRADSGRQITLDVVEEQLHLAVAAAIPMDSKVPLDCVNAGELLVEAYPQSRVAECTAGLARDVAGHFGWGESSESSNARTALPRVTPSTPAGAVRMSIVQRLARWLSPRKHQVAGNS